MSTPANPSGYPEQGYPAYPQGGYSPAPAPGYPYPYPYAPPPPRSNRTLWIVLSIVGGVVVLVCIGCVALFTVFGRFFGDIIQPTFVATQFCHDLQTPDYNVAYRLFSSRLQNQ